MCIVHFYYLEMICYNYLLKSCEKNLNALLTNDNIPKPNQFGTGLSREENRVERKQTNKMASTLELGTDEVSDPTKNHRLPEANEYLLEPWKTEVHFNCHEILKYDFWMFHK